MKTHNSPTSCFSRHFILTALFLSLALAATPVTLFGGSILPSQIDITEGDFVSFDISISSEDWVIPNAELSEQCDFVGVPNATWVILFTLQALSSGDATWGEGDSFDLELFFNNGETSIGSGTTFITCSNSSSPPLDALTGVFGIFAHQDGMTEGTEMGAFEFFNEEVPALSDSADVLVSDADMDVVSIDEFFASPDSILEGESTTISWAVSNADSCFTSEGTGGWLGSFIGLPSGSTDITINAAGLYDFTLVCSGGGEEDIATISVFVDGAGPDLAVTNVLPSKRELTPFETFTIDADITNTGDQSAGSSTARFVFSDNQFISDQDELIGTLGVPSLSPGQFWREDISANAPSDQGTYFVGVCVDPVAEEFNTANNCRDGGTITVEGTAPCPTGALACGQSVSDSLGAGSCLQGPRGPEHFSEPYILTGNIGDTVWIDAEWSFDGYLVLQGPSGFTVAQNDNDTNSSNSRLEYTFAKNGTHTLWATTFAPNDGGGDFDLSVDCQGPPGPDLTLNRPSVNGSGLLPGSSIELRTRVNNIGDVASDSSTLRWVLSSDDIISPRDPQFAQQVTPALGSGNSRSATRNTVAPTTPGTYYIGACVDAVSDESSTSNNCSTAVEIQVANDPSCSFSTLSCGSSASGRLTTSDCTDGPRGAGFFSEEFRINAVAGTSLAIDAQWSSFDGYLYLTGPNGEIVLENDNIPDPSDKFSSYIEVIIPESGEYTVWPTTLARGRTGDFDLDISCGSATAPDIVTVARLLGDPVVSVGDEITIEYEIFNVGDVPSSPTQLAMCQSPNPVISLRDTGVQIEDVELIPPGSSITRQMTVTAPDEPGNFYFGPCVFAVEGESLVDNNCAEPESQSQVQVQGQPQPLMAVGGGALAMVSNGASCSSTTLSCGQQTQGALDSGDCDTGPRGAGFLTDRFNLSLSAGDVVSVDAAWSDLDGYLYLTRPNGTVVAESDNFEGPDGSRLEFEVQSSGNYRIWPTTFAKGSEGGYQLSVDCNDPSAPDFVMDTPDLSTNSPRPGQNLTVSTVTRNVGGGPSDDSKVRYILSQTPQLTDDAIELGNSDVDGLPAGGNASASKSVRMPSTAGNYYIGVCTDFDEQELEIDNNCAMSDQFTVEAIMDPIEINVGLNDAWFNPATTGQGFFINVFPNSNQLFLAWFTYDTVRPPGNVNADLGDPGHRWRTAFGTFDQGIAELDIELTRGGVFDNVPPIPSQSMDGTIEIAFSDCNNGSLSYTIPSIGRSGVIPIQRIALDNSQECEDLINAVPARADSSLTKAGNNSQVLAGGLPPEQVLNENLPTSLGINPALNDAWFNPDTSGQGFFVNVFPDSSQLFLAWFTYDTSRPPNGTPANLAEPGHRWMTAFGDFSGDVAELDIEITSGGVFDSGSPMPTQVTDGSMTLTFENCNDGMVEYNIPSIGRAGSIPIQRIGLDSVPICEVAKSGGQSDTEAFLPPNSTELANLCDQAGGTNWEFDWPDVEGANLYAVQVFSPDNPLGPNNERPDRGFEELTQESFLRKPIVDQIENSRRLGWQWRFKPLLGVHKLAREWSEVFTFDVRPEADPCLD